MTQPLILGVLREAEPSERRVALVPAAIPGLKKTGVEILVQTDAGRAAGFTNEQYADKGASIVTDRAEVFSKANIILQVHSLGACSGVIDADIALLRKDQVLIAGCEPLWCPEMIAKAAATGATIFSLELVPRITRAQSMDILSSMATIAGYRAVLLAAAESPRMFPMMMTAAGTLKPARVLVIGAGVAGLQAIASAKRMGAVVFGYDIRPAVKEQVESLGGKFVVLDVKADNAESAGGYAKQMSDEFYRQQREALKKVIADCDVVITTAAIPGKKAPVLVTREMVEAMAPGSVIVDIAAERGGNCEVTVAGETIDLNGVKILGPVNLASSIPVHASEMFSKNITTFLLPIIKSGAVKIDTDDEVIRETLVARNGEVVHERVRGLLNPVAVGDADEKN
ncbi:MAG TPA: Re/Si-specific NAD(P)(+) transhydrogenase subunit alpha [Planctomycetaceae bacterium]|nr:Re/Si-specific NAD(P)(+) transhydrogenase subunit alpha [Planctomycetaceae bacterium]